MKTLQILVCVVLLTACGKERAENNSLVENKPITSLAENSHAEEMTKSEIRNASGKITTSGYLLDGKKHGTWVEFYDNDLPKTVTSYYLDKKEGLYLEFNARSEERRVGKECA